VTLPGTVATEVLPLDSVTTAPWCGAGLDRVTVPVELLPPVTLVGLRLNEERAPELEGLTVSVAFCVLPLKLAEMATAVVELTDTVVTVKVALVAPEATVTLEGTVATAVSPLLSETTAPPEGATPDRVTVPVELLPPVTLLGLRLTDETVGSEPDEPGRTVRIAGATMPR